MSTSALLRRTALFESHVRLGGRIVDFHGWELPVQYESILREHEAVRHRCGLFDVSHMGQVFVSGPQALAFLQKVDSNDVGRLVPGRALYSHLTNERGGVVDDVIVSRLGEDRWLVVVNAATADKDFAWFQKQARGLDVELRNESDRHGMIAVQGPKAAEVVALLAAKAPSLPRFGALELPLFGQPSVITRTGYTGEDGFEFIVPNEIVVRVWSDLLTMGRSLGATPCGLGARDVLRLEAGYLLYGQDVDDDHTPYEANYGWVVKLGKGDFIGRSALETQKAEGVRRRLTGVKLLERGVPRPGAPVLIGGREAGKLCSATFSPALQAGIGVGYLSAPLPEPGTPCAVVLHGREVRAEIAKVPFYQSPHLAKKGA
ncbi:MAG: glycine cleavage system aminomethyltransferase GcvT [Elusimicrobia bacterium]|nr:glycine cleavage system aminomethyltransferase GcvT [Elusimicrobiota bacterium]